uniref:Tissue inhibitor of metalloprotease-2 n=1 Tax=Ancylostoma caninum TaxID=29170 RepID=B1Q143_ANCCA|nr:tissue inhibitor of metalloprotease-2 [Ancylostoma caninum]
MISLIVFIACLTTTQAACSCKPFGTLKEAFCQSDYVLLAKVLSVNSKYGESSRNEANDMSTTANGTWSYHVWHMRTWKGPVVDTSVLTTSYSECGVTGLLKNWDYFLTGKQGKDGEITITSCDFVMPSTDVTPEEHDLLMDLMGDPKKCEEKDDERDVKENENSVEENDEKDEEENGEKTVEENDEKTVEENDEKVEEENGEKTVEENDEKTVEENDEKDEEENGEKTVEENDEKTVEENDEQE